MRNKLQQDTSFRTATVLCLGLLLMAGSVLADSASRVELVDCTIYDNVTYSVDRDNRHLAIDDGEWMHHISFNDILRIIGADGSDQTESVLGRKPATDHETTDASPKQPAAPAKYVGKIHFTASFGTCKPGSAVNDNVTGGSATGISIRYFKGIGFFGLSYIRSEHDGKGIEPSIKYGIEKYVFTYGGYIHRGSTIRITAHPSMGVVRRKVTSGASGNSRGGFFWGFGAALEYNIQEWLSIGPRFDFLSGSFKRSVNHYLSYNPPISFSTTEDEAALFLDLSVGITVRL